MAISFENKDGVLYVSGRLDRAGDEELNTTLERYIKGPTCRFCIDMSEVRWLTPTGAKVLIQVGQDVQDKGKQLRIIASRHVNQTLNLLGAKTWLQIENAAIPISNISVENTELQPSTSILPNVATSPLSSTPTALAATEAQTTAATSDPVSSVPVQHQVMQSTGGHSNVLASPTEHLEGGAHLLRVLVPNRRYSFRCSGGNDIIGVVRERIGGSWILVESQNSRKILNLNMVEYCEIL